ncbi:alpha/beta fold hydrolase [Lichenicoccus sp.]|uniref:alpha/beta fold hydrolase n=1 Tax=Lichenicoccus sp. TaxID=2781899 RepID=UPI003D0F1A3A
MHEADRPHDTAAVLCAGLGRDTATGHRSWRLLADALAVAGYTTLRFDYPGCGDSCDTDGGDAFAGWQQGLDAAIDWTLAATGTLPGAPRIVLIGLRFGAALATLAAIGRHDIVGLVQLEPVLRGRSYVAQLTTVARLRGQPAGAALIVDELVLSAAATRRMAELDLRQAAPGCPVALFSTAGGTFAGLEPLLRPTHLADEPDIDPTRLLSWLRTAAPWHPTGLPTPTVASVPLRPEGCIETPQQFGEAGRLFGMLCQPTDQAGGAVVVMVNPGGDPHHGYARFSVEFARRLARAGIASLRMDFAGLGDSANPNEATTHVFEADRSRDIAAALDALAALGYRRFALHGLCSGAYHAFKAALAEPRITTLLLVNLPWFNLRFEKPGPHSVARRGMEALAARPCRTLLLFAAGDPGLKPLVQQFGLAGEALQSPCAEVAILSTLDHDLTGPAMRQEAAEHMIRFLAAG